MSSSSVSTSLPPKKRGKKACTECRQQKARCDAYLSPGKACSRCQKMGTKCVISDPFRRENKRQRLSELQNETSELKRQLEISKAAAEPPKRVQAIPIMSMLTTPAEESRSWGGAGATGGGVCSSLPSNTNTPSPFTATATATTSSVSPTSTPPSLKPTVLNSFSNLFSPANTPLGLLPPSATFVPSTYSLIDGTSLKPPVGLDTLYPRRMDPDVEQRGVVPTKPRSLNGVNLTAEEVDEIFHIFFRDYAQFVPILDANISPDKYYQRSPFLFWSVIGVACRTYWKNPTLFEALPKSISEMALLSAVSSSSTPWHSIQGIILILMWPFPKDSERHELIFPLSGLLLHIAMQYGLHIPLSLMEFHKTKLPAPNEADVTRRSVLWTYCMIAYQQSCTSKGQVPRSLGELANDLLVHDFLMQNIPESLAFEMRSHEIVSRFSSTAYTFELRKSMTNLVEARLDALIRSFEAEATDLENSERTVKDHFHVNYCHMCIIVFHFFKVQTLYSCGALGKIVDRSGKLLSAVKALGRAVNGLAICTNQVSFAVLLAGVSLLRILKGPKCKGVDFNHAKALFFLSINLAREMSVASNDLPAKIHTVLTQLWNSSKSFRKPDGSVQTVLRIRSRLVLSPVVDTMWWWRDEFGDQIHGVGNVHANQAEGANPNNKNDENTGMTEGADVDDEVSSYFWADDHFFNDFEWALSDEVLAMASPPEQNPNV